MGHEIRAEMASNVWKVIAEDGSSVDEGAQLVVLESMKMEIPVVAPISGTCHLSVTEGAVLEEGQLIATIE